MKGKRVYEKEEDMSKNGHILFLYQIDVTSFPITKRCSGYWKSRIYLWVVGRL